MVYHIEPWLIQYGYYILVPLVAIEGPIVTVIAGSLVALGYLNFFVAYLVIVIGDLLGDSFYYAIGRFGGVPFVNKWGKYFGVNSVSLESIKQHFDTHGAKSLALGKISHGVGGVFLVGAGLAKMPYYKYVWYNFLATLVKSLLLLLVGYYFGDAVVKFNNGFRWAAIISFSIAFVFIGYYYLKSQKDK